MQHFGKMTNTFLHLILIYRTNFIPLQANLEFQDFKIMGAEAIQLIIIWAIGVVVFFALWAILLKVIKWISEKKSQAKEAVQEEFAEKEISPKQES